MRALHQHWKPTRGYWQSRWSCWRAWSFAVLVLAASCGGKSSTINSTQAPLRVAAAANVALPLARIDRAFTRQTGQAVELIIGASGKLSAQIQQGAPYHVLVSADLDYPQQLLAQGQARAPLREYARGQLVLWSYQPRNLATGLAVLADPGIERIAVANPATAPYGRAAKALLVAEGWWNRLSAKLVFGESIAQTNQYIESGSCQLGLTAQSAVVRPGNSGVSGSWVLVDTLLYPPIVQGAIGTVFGYRSQPVAVQAYLEFLTSPRAQEIWRSYGYLPPATSRHSNF